MFIAALALVGASTQAAIIGSGLGTVGIAALELLGRRLRGALLHALGPEHPGADPEPASSRVSAYDFSVSMGLMPLGMAMCGPIADAVGLQETLLGMSAIGLAGALAWLAQPSVRRLRRPRPGPPAPDRPAAARRGRTRRAPVVGTGGR